MTLREILFSFNGRLGRTTFWIVYAALILVLEVIRPAAKVVSPIFILIFLFPVAWVAAAIQAKRFHDVGWPAWALLINLIPYYVGPAAALVCAGFLPGTPGRNKYGTPQSSTGEKTGNAENPAAADSAAAYASDMDPDQAIEQRSLEIAANPGNAQVYSDRRKAYFKKGQYDKALEDATRVIAITPASPEAYANRGLIFAAMNDSAKAIEDFTKALAIKPDLAAVYAVRATSYRKIGEAAKAAEDEEQYRIRLGRGRLP